MPKGLLLQTTETLRVLGMEIQRSRRLRQWTEASLAERCGVSKNTIRNIEAGSPSVAVGTVFDAAVLVGIPLVADAQELPHLAARLEDRLAILPARIRVEDVDDWDDF